MWLDWLVFCDCGFQSVCPLIEKDKRLMETSWWERLRGNWVLFWWAGQCSVNLWYNFLLMGGAVFSLCYFSSVTQWCRILCNPIKCSMPGLPVQHQLPEPTQTHVHWLGDAIQPSHPLSSLSTPALNLSQHQGLFKWVNSSNEVAKVLELQLQHQTLQWTFRTDLL